MANIKMPKGDLADTLNGYHEDFELIGEPISGNEHRWYIIYSQILKHKPTGKFYRADYNHATGDNDVELTYEDEPELIEVEPYEVTITKYRPV